MCQHVADHRHTRSTASFCMRSTPHLNAPGYHIPILPIPRPHPTPYPIQPYTSCNCSCCLDVLHVLYSSVTALATCMCCTDGMPSHCTLSHAGPLSSRSSDCQSSADLSPTWPGPEVAGDMAVGRTPTRFGRKDSSQLGPRAPCFTLATS